MRALALTVLGLAFAATRAQAQATGDFRSAASGNWATAATWERYNGSAWVAAAAGPVSTDGVITVLNGHAVTNAANVTVDQVVVAIGGQLVVNSGITVTVANGSGTDMDVVGTLQFIGTGLVSGGTSTSFQLESGATLIVGSTSGISSSGSSGNIQTSTRGFSSSANYVYAGSATQSTGSGLPATVNDLTIANGSGVNLSSSTAVSGTLNLNSGAFSIGANVLTLNGSLAIGGGSLTGGSSADITIGGSGANLTLPALTLRNLTLNRPNGATLGGALSLSGTVTLTNGQLDNGSNLTLANGATISRGNGTLLAVPTFGTSANVTYTGSAAFTPGIEMPAGTTVLNNLTVNNTGGFTLTGDLTVNGNLTIGSGASLDVTANNYALTVKGNWSNNGGTFAAQGGTVTFNGTGTQAINGTATSQTFNAIVINKSAQTLSVSGSTVTLNVSNLTQTAGGFAPSTTLNITGDFIHNGGTFTGGTGTTVFNGAGTQSLGGSATTTFNKLSVNKSGGTLTADVDFTVASTFNNIAGTFDVSGRTVTLSGSGTPLVITSGTLNLANATIVYTSTSGANVTGMGYYNLTVNHSGDTFTAAGNITVTNVLTVASGTTFDASSRTVTLLASGTPLVVSGSVTPSTSTFVYTSATGANVAATTFNNLTINGGGTFALSGATTVSGSLNLTSGDLSIGANTLTLNGAISITSGTLTGGATANITFGGSSANTTLPAVTLNRLTLSRANGITLGGSVAVNGVLTLSSGALSGAANLTLGNGVTISRATGTLNGTPTFAGAVNLIYTGSTSVITSGEIPPSPATVNDFTNNNTATVMLSAPLVVNGTLAIGSSAELDVTTNNYSVAVRGSFINNSGAFTARAGTVTLDGAGAQSIGGSTALTFYNLIINKAAGTATANQSFTVSSVFTIQGGSFDGGSRTITLPGNSTPFVITGTFIPSTSTILYTGTGTTSVAGGISYCNLTVNNSGDTFVPAGDFTVNNVLNVQAGTFNATNATITLAGAGSPVTGAGTFTPAASTLIYTSATGANVLATTFNNLTINGAGNFPLAGSATINGTLTLNNGALYIGTNTLTLNGDIVPGSGTLTGGASANITVGGTGATATLPGVTSGLRNLALSRTNGLTLGGAVSVSTTLTLTDGELNNGANLTLGNGAAIVRANGSLAAAPTFGASVNLSYTGPSAVTTGPEIPTSASVLNNLTINNIGGVTLTSSPTVNGALTFTSGKITTAANQVNLTAPALISGVSSSSYVIGSVQKSFNVGTNQTFSFPVGDASNYTPAAVTSMNVSTAGSLKVNPTTGEHPNVTTSGLDASRDVNRYWTLSPSDLVVSSYGLTLNFVTNDVDAGATTTAFLIRRHDGSWSPTTIGTRTATSIAANGLSAFGDFVIGGQLLDHYSVTANSPQAVGVPFITTVTAQDALNQTVTGDSSTMVTLGNTGSAQFDSDDNSVFGDNTKALVNGTFTITTKDSSNETIDITASDTNGKTGIAAGIVIGTGANPGGPGAFRTVASGDWTNASIWETNSGAIWVPAIGAPNGSAGTIVIQSGHNITNSTDITIDQVTVNNGGQLVVNPGVTVTLTHDSGADLDVFGTLLVLDNGLITGGANTVFQLESGATLGVGSPAGITAAAAAGSIQTASRGYSGAANYIYLGSTAQASGDGLPATVANLTIANSAGVALNSSVTVSGTLTLDSGALEIGANAFTLNGALTVSSGSLSGGANADLVIGGSSGNLTLPAITSLNNLTLNRAAGITLAGDVTVNGTLTLSNGKITTGANKLNFGNSATVAGANGSNYIVGPAQKSFANGAGQSFTFPIGTASAYLPVSLSALDVSSSGSIVASTTTGEHPNLAGSGINSARDVNRYWTLTAVGIVTTDYTVDFNFSAGDVDANAIPTAFEAHRFDGAWSNPAAGTRTATSCQVAGVNGFGDFAIGETSSKLVFVQQPSDVSANVTHSPAITVQVQNSANANVAVAGIPITLALDSGSGALNGTLTKLTDASGLASFTDLSCNSAGTKTLSASSPNLTSATSGSFTVNLIVNTPVITQQPASQTVTVGDSVTMHVEATSTAPLSYQWVMNGTNILTDDIHFMGANTADLVITNASRAHGCSYSVIVSNNYGAVVSSTAALTVKLPAGVFFYDDFVRIANPGSLGSWVVESGNWSVMNETLQTTGNEPNSYAVARLMKSWMDFSVEAQIQFSEDGFGGGLGARLDPETGGRYAAWVYPGMGVLRLINFTDWSSFTVLDQVALNDVGTDPHTLKLAFVGNHIQVFFDSALMIDTHDSTHDGGTVTTEMWTGGTPYSLQFDNVLVSSLNTPPVLPAIANQIVGEFGTLVIADTATDNDLPGDELSYQLVNPPANASIDSAGVITFTPNEAQGGTTNVIITVVDDGTVAVTNSFVVVVTEVNSAPVLPSISAQTIAEGSLLSINDAATDSDMPANTLTYSLINPPAGASIDSSGLITWTPTEAQGPGNYTIIAAVNDGTVSVTNSFAITVTEANSAPVPPVISQQTVAEGSLLSVSTASTDSDLPANTLSYSLVNPPAGMSINASGLISWTPTEIQGPSTNIITAMVSDGQVSVFNSFVVVVTEVNSAPTLPVIGQQIVTEKTLLSVNNAASDSDLPANTLTYTLINPPAGATINGFGHITWTPSEAQGPSTNLITTVVNDGTASATNSFVVVVTEVNSAPVLPSISSQTVAEGSLLSIDSAAVDGDLPANTLNYSLINAPGGMSINGNGLITWIPSEAQGPATNTVTVVVDDGIVSAFSAFVVVITEVNSAPVLPAISQQTVVEGSLWSVNSAATDSDLPANPLTYSLVNPPAGLSINASGLITWTPTEAQGPSTNTITVVVNDGTVSVTNSFVAVVTEFNTAPVLPTITQQTVAEGSLLSVSDAATDNDLPVNTLTYSLVNPPAGMSIDASGLITWTPTEAQGPSTNNIVAVVNDGTVSVTNSFKVVVTEVNSAPVLPTISEQTLAEGSLLGINNAATDTDLPANVLSYSLVNPPAGMTINSSGLITWTPTEAQGPSTNMISAVVKDGTVSVTNSFVVVVTEVNAAPVLPTIAQQTVAEGNLLSVNCAASDSDWPANTLTYSLPSAPAALGSLSGMTIDANGLITWTPTEAQGPSTNVVTVVVSDGSLSVTNSFVVVVTEANSAPVVPPISQQTIAEGSLLSVNCTATDSDLPANSLTYSLVNPPAGMNIDAAGHLTWTPTEAQGPSTNAIAVVVNDGTVNVTNSFVVVVTEVNSTPVLPNISQQTVVEGSLLSVNCTATDSDLPANSLTYSLLNSPVGASVNNSGLVTWTPTEAQGPSTNTITVVVNDGTVSVTNSFVVVVTEANSAPVLPSISQQTVAEGGLLSINSTATDSDLPANVLTYSLVNPPVGASIDGNGHITWTPTEAQGPSTNTITVVVNDGIVSVTNSFVVVVTEANSAPVLPSISQQTVAEGDLLSINIAATDSDLPANTLTYSLVNSPVGASIDSNGQITWTPTEAQGPSTNTITVVVNDGTVSTTNSITVMVTEVNQAPLLSEQMNHTVDVWKTLSVTNTASDSDLPANPLTYSLLNPPAGMTIDANGVVHWTPTADQGNTTNIITTVVSDGTLSTTNSFTVTVIAIVPPTITNISVVNGVATITWNSVADHNYRLQYKEDLNGGWTDVTPDVSATGASTTGTNNVGAAPQRFFRVLLVP